ncbi:MAG: hypothetical protein ACTS44_01615 [Candidatus Hodgkinia cicadicola]
MNASMPRNVRTAGGGFAPPFNGFRRLSYHLRWGSSKVRKHPNGGQAKC